MAYIVDHTIIEIARIEKSGTQGSTFKANKPDQDRLTIELQILGGSRLVVVDLQKVTQNKVITIAFTIYCFGLTGLVFKYKCFYDS